MIAVMLIKMLEKVGLIIPESEAALIKAGELVTQLRRLLRFIRCIW